MNIKNPSIQNSAPPRGRAYWRSVEEHASSAEVAETMEGEFQDYSPGEMRSLSRRTFLQLGAAGMALAGLTMTGCRRWPERKLAPYAERPEGFMPGEPELYATMSERNGVALGLVATSYDGRPIKVEGNPLHPGSLGATDLYAQASILDLYDVDRARMISHGEGETATWDVFFEEATSWMRGGGVAVLSEASGSPTLMRVREAFLAAVPGATWTTYEPIHRDQEIQGLQAVTGREVRVVYDVSKAKVLGLFDSDLLGSHPNWVRNARGWADRRRLAGDSDGGGYSRMYVAEPSFTVTGSNADERLAVGPREVGAALRLVAAGLGVGQAAPGDESRLGGRGFIKYLIADLKAARGESIVAVGPDQPAAMHALAHRVNQALGNVGQTISYVPEPMGAASAGAKPFVDLVNRMNSGGVQTLLILGGNPVYDAPPAFAAALPKVRHAAHLAFTYNETSALCDWRLPMAHYLECWGDGRSWDGTVSLQQPLILPLFDGKSPAELLASLMGAEQTQGYDIVRTTFREQFLEGVQGDGFESRWRKVLHVGVLEGSAFEPVEVGGGGGPGVSALADMPAKTGTPGAEAGTPTSGTNGGFEVQFRPDPSVFDGRYANNGWLQELPDPMTKVCWDNPALVNVHDADALGVETGSMLRVSLGDASLDLPVYVMPGQARGVVTLSLGYGRTAAGRIGGVSDDNTVGFDAYPLRHAANAVGNAAAPIAVAVARATGSYDLAMTQHHHLIELDAVGRFGVVKRAGEKGENGMVIREASLDEFLTGDWTVMEGQHDPGAIPLQLFQSPYPAVPHAKRPGGPTAFNNPHAWGMSIDMNSCIGCSACVIACQAENNIPVVGRQQVARGREMHWLRIDTYYKGEPDTADGTSPDVVRQPMMCVHCENAPCEQVCPVAATVHDTEGLNAMVYNRCIGTRYCSNNCPYKVRRFNWFDYHQKPPHPTDIPGVQALPYAWIPDTQQGHIDPLKQMAFNPDVTVRMRGVMEKCTYCVQRIKRTEIAAKADWAQTIDGEGHDVGDDRTSPDLDFTGPDAAIQTACQQACPTQAIIFGDLNQREAKVSQLHASSRAYGVLADLNTRPRTMHLAKVRNPAGNPNDE